jgi:cytochrome c55X
MLWLHLSLLLSLSAGLAGVAVAVIDIPAPREAELRNLVEQDCSSCHGITLRGGLGKPLLPAQFEGVPEAAIASVILDGVAGTPMPPWRGLISEPEALWIARQLKEGSIP